MLTEITKHLDDFYGHQRQSYISYEKEGKTIHKKFTIEYCDDKDKLERVGLLREYGGLQIDDAYHSRHFEEKTCTGLRDSFEGIVVDTYIRMLFNPKIYDVKLFEEIYDGDELVQERWIAFPSTFYYELAKVIEKSVTESRDNLQKQVELLEKEVNTFVEFLKEMNAENTYKEWKEKRRT